MKMMRVLGWLVALGVAAGCGDQRLASRFVKSVPVTASQGATLTVSASEDPELAGAQLVIPPGALAQDTVITLDKGLQSLVQSPNLSAGPVAIWGPSGTRFSADVQMTLPFSPPTGAAASDPIFIGVWEDDGTHTTIPASQVTLDSTSRQVSFAVRDFTSYQPGLQPDCQADSDCASGEVCVNGACESARDAGPDCSVDCRQTNCAPPLGICPPNEGIACSQATGNWTCLPQQDAGPYDAGPGPDAGHCRTDSDCPAGEFCDINNGFVCAPASDGGPVVDGGPVADAGPTCVTNVDCPGGDVCVNGICEVAYDAGPGPDAGQVDGGPVCQTDADCPSGDVCVNGACEWNYDGGSAPDGGAYDAGPAPDAGLACRTDTDCPYPLHCLNAVCQ